MSQHLEDCWSTNDSRITAIEEKQNMLAENQVILANRLTKLEESVEIQKQYSRVNSLLIHFLPGMPPKASGRYFDQCLASC